MWWACVSVGWIGRGRAGRRDLPQARARRSRPGRPSRRNHCKVPRTKKATPQKKACPQHRGHEGAPASCPRRDHRIVSTGPMRSRPCLLDGCLRRDAPTAVTARPGPANSTRPPSSSRPAESHPRCRLRRPEILEPSRGNLGHHRGSSTDREIIRQDDSIPSRRDLRHGGPFRRLAPLVRIVGKSGGQAGIELGGSQLRRTRTGPRSVYCDRPRDRQTPMTPPPAAPADELLNPSRGKRVRCGKRARPIGL